MSSKLVTDESLVENRDGKKGAGRLVQTQQEFNVAGQEYLHRFQSFAFVVLCEDHHLF